MTDEGGLSFLGRRLAPTFLVRFVALSPDQQRSYVPEEWSDTLVVVERGAIELLFLSGARRVFVRGDVLCLDGLPLRSLRTHGEVQALLSAVTRSTSSAARHRPVGASDSFSAESGLSR